MDKEKFRSINELGKSNLPIQFVLTDIDDTITDSGKLSASAYSSLWDLYQNGYTVIPVTGRPAGWCDMIIRQWPVDAVVGENGAFTYYNVWEDDTHRIKTLYHPNLDVAGNRNSLDSLRKKILSSIPGTRIARDQTARQFDLAIDFREDHPDLGFHTAENIKKLCVSEGAEAKISSIHVNAWFGQYDKLSMIKIFLSENYNLGDEEMKKQVLFCGDSPNDQPMFEFFPLSCAVANIRQMSQQITFFPDFITESDGGKGFTELVNTLLKK